MLLPTMTLDDIFKAVQADLIFVMQKLSDSVQQLGKASLRTNKFPFKRKFEWKNHKSVFS